MNISPEPLPACLQDPSVASQTLSALGFSGADRLAQLNVYAGLAAIDNSTHHFSTLVNSTTFDELIEFQIQSLLPAAESAKAYVGQVLAFFAATSREFEDVIEGKVSSIQDKVYDELYAGLATAEANGIPLAGIAKDSLMLVKDASRANQVLIRNAVSDSLKLRYIKSGGAVVDVVAKPPK